MTQKSREEMAAAAHEKWVVNDIKKTNGREICKLTPEVWKRAYLAGFDEAHARLQAENQEFRQALTDIKENQDPKHYGNNPLGLNVEPQAYRIAANILAKYPRKV